MLGSRWRKLRREVRLKAHHVDIASVEKYFEAIRLALSNEPINFLGFPYGTQLDSQYAELYRDEFRTMVMDANLDRIQDEIYSFVTESGGYKAALRQVFIWYSRNSSCAFHHKNAFPIVFDNFITAANRNPIPAP